MKKSIIASIVAMGLFSGLTQAAEKEVQSVGAVTTVTCDLESSVDGSDTLMPNVIHLGEAKVGGGKGTAVAFTFKPKQDQANIASCNTMQDNGSLNIIWTGSFENGGLKNISGDAADAHVKIQATNATGASNNKVIMTNGEKHAFSPALLKDGTGLKYTATLAAGNTPGKVETAAKFNLEYK